MRWTYLKLVHYTNRKSFNTKKSRNAVTGGVLQKSCYVKFCKSHRWLQENMTKTWNRSLFLNKVLGCSTSFFPWILRIFFKNFFKEHLHGLLLNNIKASVKLKSFPTPLLNRCYVFWSAPTKSHFSEIPLKFLRKIHSE